MGHKVAINRQAIVSGKECLIVFRGNYRSFDPGKEILFRYSTDPTGSIRWRIGVLAGIKDGVFHIKKLGFFNPDRSLYNNQGQVIERAYVEDGDERKLRHNKVSVTRNLGRHKVQELVSEGDGEGEWLEYPVLFPSAVLDKWDDF